MKTFAIVAGSILAAGAVAAGVVYVARKPALGSTGLPPRPLPIQAIVPAAPPQYGFAPPQGGGGDLATQLAAWEGVAATGLGLASTVYGGIDQSFGGF